jgi:hypothetical protein
MRVKFKTFGFEREMTLEQALQQRHSDEPHEQIARLLAHLVECGQLEIGAAFSIAGVYVEELEVVK